MHRGINYPSSRTLPPPLFLAKPLSNLQTVQAPFFRQSPHSISIFCERPPKSQVFQWEPKLLKFFILNPILSFKITKLLVKFSQFEFLVMTEKHIFAYKLFFSLNISDFSLSFCKKCILLKKVTPLFSSNPPLKVEVLPSPLPPPCLFKNLVGGSTPCTAERGCTLCLKN